MLAKAWTAIKWSSWAALALLVFVIWRFAPPHVPAPAPTAEEGFAEASPSPPPDARVAPFPVARPATIAAPSPPAEDDYVLPQFRKFGYGLTPEQISVCEVHAAKLLHAGFAERGRALSAIEFDLGGDAAVSLSCGKWPDLLFFADRRLPSAAFFRLIGIGAATFIDAPAQKISSLAMRCQLQALKAGDGSSDIHFAEGAMFCNEGENSFDISIQRPDPPEKPAKSAKRR